MKTRTESPKIIALKEITDSGDCYSYTRASGELNEFLEDVIGDQEYSISVEIRPAGNAYQCLLNIDTSLKMDCAICGKNFDHPIKEQINEILMLSEDMGRKGKNSRVNHSTELDLNGPECTFLPSWDLNVGEYVREFIALAEPYQAKCSADCSNLLKSLNSMSENWDCDSPEKNPFAALKDFKLNS